MDPRREGVVRKVVGDYIALEMERQERLRLGLWTKRDEETYIDQAVAFWLDMTTEEHFEVERLLGYPTAVCQ